MPLKFNNTNIEKVIYNGVNLDKVIYNGVTVWENWVYKTTEIKKSLCKSDGGWNEWAGSDTGWITFNKPIKNAIGTVWMETRDTSASNVRLYLRFEDGTEVQPYTKSEGYHGSNEYGSGSVDFNTGADYKDKVIIAYKLLVEHKKFSGYTNGSVTFKTYYQKG